MKTFKQFLEEKKNDQAYGWLNDKGSFIRNRDGRIHGDTYTKHTGVRIKDYWKKIDHATKQGWHRLDIYKDERDKAIWGVHQGDKTKWTDRHTKAMNRIKKALGASDYKDDVEQVAEGKRYVAEGNPLARVKKHIDDNRPFAGISAERSHLSAQENKKRMKDLESRVRSMGYGFKKAEGRWEGGKEASLKIHANGTTPEHHEKFKKDMIELGKHYDQDAIFHHDGQAGKLIGTNDTGYPGKDKVEPVGKVRYNRPEAPFQTELKPRKKNSASFTTGD